MAEPVPFTIHHVAVMVRDIDAALAFYRDGLGLRVVSDEANPAVSARLLFLDGGGATLQLVQPTGPGPLLTHLTERGEGLHHICFAVPDLEAALRRLAPGAEVTVNTGTRGRVAFLPDEPNGVRIELLETGGA